MLSPGKLARSTALLVTPLLRPTERLCCSTLTLTPLDSLLQRSCSTTFGRGVDRIQEFVGSGPAEVPDAAADLKQKLNADLQLGDGSAPPLSAAASAGTSSETQGADQQAGTTVSTAAEQAKVFSLMQRREQGSDIEKELVRKMQALKLKMSAGEFEEFRVNLRKSAKRSCPKKLAFSDTITPWYDEAGLGDFTCDNAAWPHEVAQSDAAPASTAASAAAPAAAEPVGAKLGAPTDPFQAMQEAEAAAAEPAVAKSDAAPASTDAALAAAPTAAGLTGAKLDAPTDPFRAMEAAEATAVQKEATATASGDQTAVPAVPTPNAAGSAAAPAVPAVPAPDAAGSAAVPAVPALDAAGSAAVPAVPAPDAAGSAAVPAVPAPDAAGSAAALAVPAAVAAAATDAMASVPAASAASEAGQQERGGSNANDDDRVRIDEFALASERETAREMGWAVADTEPVSGGEF